MILIWEITKEKPFTRSARLQDYFLLLNHLSHIVYNIFLADAGLLYDPDMGDNKRKTLHSLCSFTGLCFSCLMQASLQRLKNKTLPLSRKGFSFVGVAGFEPATLWSQTRCANRAALHPVLPAEVSTKAD